MEVNFTSLDELLAKLEASSTNLKFDKVVWHNEHHLRQIRKALNR